METWLLAVPDMRQAVRASTPEDLVGLLEAFDVSVQYDHLAKTVEISVVLAPELAEGKARPRSGFRTFAICTRYRLSSSSHKGDFRLVECGPSSSWSSRSRLRRRRRLAPTTPKQSAWRGPASRQSGQKPRLVAVPGSSSRRRRNGKTHPDSYAAAVSSPSFIATGSMLSSIRNCNSSVGSYSFIRLTTAPFASSGLVQSALETASTNRSM